MVLGLKHPGRAKGAGQGSASIDFYHQPSGRRSSVLCEKLTRLVNAWVKAMLPKLN